jgi:hypothetical protein
MRRPFNGKHATHAGLAAALLAGAGVAHADLILLGQVDMQGTGLGNVPTVLTIQSPGSSSNEQGSVAWNGTTNVTTGDTQAITQTRTIAESGATAASNFRVVFNPVEPGTAATNSITLNDLEVTFFNAAGAVLFRSGELRNSNGTLAPINFSSTEVGTGNAGFVFGLNAAQQAQATAAGAFSNTANRVGLAAIASNATGGHETFFIGNQGGSSTGGLPPLVGPIPEPGTMAMLATGLLAMGGIARRRRQS